MESDGRSRDSVPLVAAQDPGRGERRLAQPVQYLKGVGPERAKALARLGIRTVEDLIRHIPRRHEDRTQPALISRLAHGQLATITGVVTDVAELRPRRGLLITRVGVTDGQSVAWGVWFNQPYTKRQFQPGQRVILSGRVDRRYGRVEIQSPEHEIDDGSDPIHTGRIVPIYPLTQGVTQRWLRRLVHQTVEQAAADMPEPLPELVRQRHGLVSAAPAWRAMHFPNDSQQLTEARRRLAFEELFLMQIVIAVAYQGRRRRPTGIVHAPDGDLLRRLLAGLPFQLTGAQARVWREITADMESPYPMNRLLQGDVGSGKTVLAAMAMAKAAEGGWQSALMAPTEILAEQHWRTLSRWLQPLGLEVALLTGSRTGRAREETLARLATGQALLAVGTHALIQQGVHLPRLGLAISDEQHRFGVRQRGLLQAKGRDVDVLVMTATPIPRTLAMTLYGDLDVSLLDELPPGRIPPLTRVLKASERGQAYRLIREQVRLGRQAYVVCPLVEESDKLEAQAASELAERLSKHVFPDLRVGCVHGRLKPEERAERMDAFRRGELDVLVATTVIEVGVDVPNATVMVVEDADRFGLSQLHQLRGRVGRGSQVAYCLLVASPRSGAGAERLAVLAATHDGFRIAEEDLRLRGPGELVGTRQHGLPALALADPIEDLPLLELARREAQALVADDPSLSEHPALLAAVAEPLAEATRLIQIG